MVSAVSLARSPMLDCGRLALVMPTANLWRHCMDDRRSSQRIPPTTVRRLSAYYRALGALVEQGVPHVSSKALSDLAGSTAPQVRRDLAYFGSFGTRGVGYSVAALRAQLARILGIDRSWPLGLVGVGNLGRALLAYRGFRGPEYTIAAAFDTDPAKIGAVVDQVVAADVHAILNFAILNRRSCASQQACGSRTSTSQWKWSRSPMRLPTDGMARAGRDAYHERGL